MAPFSFFRLDLDHEEFAYVTGAGFRGLTISKRGIGWNVILRGVLGDSRPVYAMTECDDVEEGLQNLLAMLASGSGRMMWHNDKFASGYARKGG